MRDQRDTKAKVRGDGKPTESHVMALSASLQKQNVRVISGGWGHEALKLSVGDLVYARALLSLFRQLEMDPVHKRRFPLLSDSTQDLCLFQRPGLESAQDDRLRTVLTRSHQAVKVLKPRMPADLKSPGLC